ncbi:hypothetical protein ARMSODRAFT_1023299 [Armillaria solidipes]|uniref:Uncharacterized protein n=1 Tax=Armillaria solidipes TaxID=1076256 RepID=A0A2H3BDM4_9AGAR|nr:hypothetical protein ARMSODRAFT_1023299 [Armillaria solidipes]
MLMSTRECRQSPPTCDSRLTPDRGFMIAKAFAANGVKIYITRRRLDVLAKAAASVTSVPGPLSQPRWTSDEESIRPGPSTLKRSTESSIFSSTSSYVEPSVPLAHTPMLSESWICWSCNPDFITKNTRAEDPSEPQIVQRRADIFALNAIAPFFAMRAFQLLLVKGAQSRPRGTSTSAAWR